MLLACWSVQGGAGTTVVSTTLALLLAGQTPTGTVLADLTGDSPGVLGMTEPETPGVADWLAAGDRVPIDALTRLEVDSSPGLALLTRGFGPMSADRAPVLGALLDRSQRPVVADCGNLSRHRACPAALGVARAASRSLLVLRPTRLTLRHIAACSLQASGTVLVSGPATAAGPAEIERVTFAPVVATVPEDPAVTAAVDSGLLTARLPRALAKGLENAV